MRLISEQCGQSQASPVVTIKPAVFRAMNAGAALILSRTGSFAELDRSEDSFVHHNCKGLAAAAHNQKQILAIKEFATIAFSGKNVCT